MRASSLGLLSGMAAIAAACAPFPTPTSSAPGSPIPTSQLGPHPHVMVIVLENREYADVVGSADAPYTNRLIAAGGLATASYGITHPSLPNYLALISGSTSGITSDCTDCSASGPNLSDQMLAAGIRWRAYMESLPYACYTGAGVNGGYAKKHDPFMYFPQIANNPERCANVVPMDTMTTELNGASPPGFAFVVPNLCDDGHDCGTQTSDSWLATNVPSILASPWYQANGVVIITWDEGGTNAGCCNGAAGGHIATIVLSKNTVGGSTLSTPVDHYGVLATIETEFQLPLLGGAACPCAGSLTPLLAGYKPQK